MSLFDKRKNIPLAEISTKTISYWQRVYREGIYTIAVNSKLGYFRVLKKKELDKTITHFLNKPNPENITEKTDQATALAWVLITASWLGGDVELITDLTFKNELLQKAGDIILSKFKIDFPSLSNLIK